MKALVIGKPVYDFILPLVEFPQDGDKFLINSSINTISNFSSVITITLAKYGIDTSFTGVVGEDNVAEKIKEIFTNNKVDITYLETSFQEHTCINHKIYNQKTNIFTDIFENSLKQGLLKYKYEFIPDVVIMDDSDYNANMAAINNYGSANLIYVGEKYSNESTVYAKKCNYLISNLKFASEITGVLNNLNKPKTIVALFQKYLDLYESNLIIVLDNFDVLYCLNDEIRLIKNVNTNLNNKRYLYYSLLIYFILNTKSIENSIKYTNKIMLTTNNDINILKNIPDYNEVVGYINATNANEQNAANISNNKPNPEPENIKPVEVTKIESSNQNNNNSQDKGNNNERL